ncbi:MAG TPA: conjugal transfer protein TraS [Candidatus Margulisiibacteriota bacterium]|nr:conjugal transfer protein TraS [Candidatus Margulisiibacteriota bacterium]
MTTDVDGILVHWGERLFYPQNRIVKGLRPPRLTGGSRMRAATIRARIKATVVRRAPQVMVRVTGGGRGMAAIAAHFRYISKDGRLPFEDDRGITREGMDALRDLADQWRYGGSFIDETSPRREACNIMLSMPSGTDPLTVQRAAREFAQQELADHRYVMVLHDHQANPHVHISVRAESCHGKRLNPRKADLQRWRETFAERLRGWGIEAESSRQATRGQVRNYDSLWRVKAAERGSLIAERPNTKTSPRSERSRQDAVFAWVQITQALADSEAEEDRALARSIDRYVRKTPFGIEYARKLRDRAQVEPARNSRGQLGLDLPTPEGHLPPAQTPPRSLAQQVDRDRR